MNNIIITNPDLLKDKINKIKLGKIQNLHIVADFDNTLTKAYLENGEKFDSAIAQIRKGGYLTPEYPKQAFALFDKYHPIEIDPSIPNDDKNKYMVEWWSEHLKLKIKSGMNKDVLKDIIAKNKIQLRDKTTDFLKFTKENNIPILILSAGLGDLIVMELEKENCNFDNVHIISNFYNYNNDGTINGYKGQIIHSFNKDETEVKLLPHYHKIADRKNVILLGDGLGDLEMAKGINYDNILKIGFYNKKEKENDFEQFQKGYDVLILNDGSMNYVLELLKILIK